MQKPLPPQPVLSPPARKPAPEPVEPPAESARPAPEAPSREGIIFRALLEAGVDTEVAYTADRRLERMISETVAPQLQPFVVEVRRRFDALDRKLDEHDRRLDEHDRRLDEHGRKLDVIMKTLAVHGEKLLEHDRKLDVIVARLDGLQTLGRLMVGAYALLITVLIAVFGLLFTR